MSLAKKLTDNDLYAVLSCIKETVKRLKLTGCINITGRGLSPLQFSTALELIDLSLLKQYEDTSTRIESRLCQETVIPILGSIISVQGCLLKHIQFLHEWIRAPSTRFVNFNNSYAQHLYRLGISCSKCNNVIRGRTRHISLNDILFCCYSCLKPICERCVRVRICGICDKMYCSGCLRANQRDSCTQCFMTVCGGCKYNHMSQCSGCDAKRCNKCSRISGPLCRNCIEFDNDVLDWFEEESDVDLEPYIVHPGVRRSNEEFYEGVEE